MDHPFDYDKAMEHVDSKDENKLEVKIPSDELRKILNLELADLLYHVHRVSLQGNNSPGNSWYLPIDPSEELS